MASARYWRIVGIDTYAGDLELSELQLFSASGRVDQSATLSCSHAPASGTLSALSDGSTAATCQFDASQVRSPGFFLQWDFGAATADVTGLRPGSGALQHGYVAQLTLQAFVSDAWVTYGTFGRYLWPGAMALAPEPVTVSVIPATFDPAVKSTILTLSNGNRTISANAAGYSVARSTVGLSAGKYYLEMTRNASDMMIGVSNATPTTSSYIGADGSSMGLWRGEVYLSGGVVGNLPWADVAAPIGMLVDADARTLRYKVGTTLSASMAIPWSGDIYLVGGNGTSSAFSTFSIVLNAGQEPFSYEVPNGFLAGFGPLTSAGGTGFGDPCYVSSLPAHLVFDELADSSQPVNLVFVCERHGPGPQPGETIVVPVRRTYIVINNITLHRVDTGAELHAYSFNMSLDYQSWTWAWNASLHSDAAPHLGRDSAGDPPELAVIVNGVEFRLRLERKSRDRRFSPTRWAVSGRGKASVLGSDDAPRQSFRNTADRTAQQLMADVLTVNGVPMGWTIDWGLDDWLVPAGAWALQGNYIDAINDIAGAAGGYVQPHNTAATLRVLPRYPLPPWEWGSVTSYVQIPDAAAEVEGTEYIDKPAYNRVFVGGIGAGVFGPFTRAGTAGNVIAPPVNHALITHPDVHRQRGIAELSDTGRQEIITLNMQVLPESGVIVPGQFVRYQGESTVMGIVRSTSIDWSRPRLRQTLEVETHA